MAQLYPVWAPYTPRVNSSMRGGVVRAAPWVILFAVATEIAWSRIGPLAAGQVGYDSAASVLYFERIMAGQRLEAFVAATPKALLTVVYGVLYTLTHDWRPISMLAVGIFGLNVTLGAVLARRLAGPVAAAFVAMGFLGSSALLEDASAAYAVGPALVGWLIAGLALTSARPRYTIAGLALMLAGLARSRPSSSPARSCCCSWRARSSGGPDRDWCRPGGRGGSCSSWPPCPSRRCTTGCSPATRSSPSRCRRSSRRPPW